MSTSSKMNSISNLNLIHSDDTEHPTTPVSNMPFDESIEFRTSDCVSSEVIDKINELQESQRFGKEDFNVYKFDCLPPLPPTKEEEKDDEEGVVDEIEQRTYKGHYYIDSMDMEETMRRDAILLKKFKENDSFNIKKFEEFKDKIGDGNMEYIKDPNTREMCTNAWKAITFSNNWDFVVQNIESFMWSDDPRIDAITEKMEEFGYNGHSGTSFGFTMRNMQYLVQNGEDKFKKLFDEISEDKNNKKFLDYSGGF